jgi:hypothetical protein
MISQRGLLSRIFVIATIFCGSLTIISAQRPGAKAKAAGSISGRITIGGKAAPAIPVVAVAGQTVNVRDATARAVTDADGNYRISGLGAGQYQIWTLTPDMVAEPSSYPNYFSYAGADKSIILGADEDVTGVDLRLVRGSVITGRVTNSDNQPAVEEHVTLQLLDQNDNARFGAIRSPYDQMFQTDDRGVYRIFGLSPGRYRVSAGYDAANDGVLRGSRYEKKFYLDPNDQSKPGIVALSEADETRDIDIKVQAARSVYAISGRVIDSETGVAIPRAGVSFMQVQKEKTPPTPGFVMQADERGEFSYSGFAPGHYAISAGSEFYGGNLYGDPVYVDVADKDVTGLEIKGVPGLSLSGFISADGLSTKALLALLPGLTVSASSTSKDQVRTGGRAVVAPDGSFQVEGLRPGLTSLFVSTQRPTFISTTIARLDHDGVTLNENFNLQQSMSGLNVVIDYGTGSIRGSVKLEGDTPITDARMYVNCKRAGARYGTGAQVDARGHFVITNLAAGEFELTLQVNSLTPRPPRGIPLQKQIVTVTNGAETEVTFVIDLTPQPGGP